MEVIPLMEDADKPCDVLYCTGSRSNGVLLMHSKEPSFSIAPENDFSSREAAKRYNVYGTLDT